MVAVGSAFIIARLAWLGCTVPSGPIREVTGKRGPRSMMRRPSQGPPWHSTRVKSSAVIVESEGDAGWTKALTHLRTAGGILDDLTPALTTAAAKLEVSITHRPAGGGRKPGAAVRVGLVDPQGGFARTDPNARRYLWVEPNVPGTNPNSPYSEEGTHEVVGQAVRETCFCPT